jgi:glutamyl-tRNA synthetase
MKQVIRKWALKNALDHRGKALAGAVLNKVLGELPELRERMGEIARVVEELVREVNKLSLEQQMEELSKIAPELLKKRVKEKELPPLPKAIKGKVVTRLAPEPSGYMHIGHAMSFFLNYLYAKRYEGKVWLRFEDTDPRKAKLEFYEDFKQNIRWLGIDWDEERVTSKNLNIYYRYAEKLIEQGNAYICTCELGHIRTLRFAGVPCKCRGNSVGMNLELWEKLFSDFKEGEAVWRLKGDLESKNYVMRDPTLFRIVDHPHALVGEKFRVWPTYDFACAMEDALCKITHVLRSNEFALRGELQNFIRELLGLRSPEIIEYSRFKFKGTPVAKRKLRPLIRKGLVGGWNDIRLPTMIALRRRGISAEAIGEFTISVGLTRTQPQFEWDLLLSINRKLIDPIAKRYFFVPDPIRLVVKDAPPKIAKLKYHPSKRKSRMVRTRGKFYIPREDTKKFKIGEVIRLKDLYNVRIENVGKARVIASFAGEKLVEGIPKIQWVTEDNIKLRVLIPGPLFIDGKFNRKSLREIEGLGEKEIASLKVGEVIQLERVCFGRVDSKEPFTICFAHR